MKANKLYVFKIRKLVKNLLLGLELEKNNYDLPVIEQS